MNGKCKLCALLAALFALASAQSGCGKPLPAPVETPTLISDPAPTQVGAGQSFSVTITITPSRAIAGVQCDLVFDGALFSVTGVSEGDFLKQSGAPTYFYPGNSQPASIIDISGIVLTAGKSASGPGTLAVITFRAGAATGSGSFSLAGVVIGDVNSSPVAFSVSGASTRVGPVTG